MPQSRSRMAFTKVDYPEPHRDQASRIIKAHPEVRELFGREPGSAYIIAGTVLLQLVLAFLVRNAPWWQILVLSWAVGAFANHALWVLIHECTHDLILRWRTGNRLLGILANVPIVIPSSESFRACHLRHHRYQGDPARDMDLPSEWEARLVGNTFIGKLLWQIFFPVFQALRVWRLYKHDTTALFSPWITFNSVVILATNVLIYVFVGPGAFFYLALSLVFSIGPHPCGARWVQEHFLVFDDLQDTGSYYGALNKVALNVGYHNEHHDFPFVAWPRLPRLSALAPEVYNQLHRHTSWMRLWFRFLTDPDISLYSRVIRDGDVNLRRRSLSESPGAMGADRAEVATGAPEGPGRASATSATVGGEGSSGTTQGR